MSSLQPTTQRIAFVDLLRGWAVIIMIETHVVNALLMPSLREHAFFSYVTFFNGLVAPSFLFCAGFAFAITLQKKWIEYISFNKSFWLYIRRLLFILIVGYALHLPLFSLGGMMNLSDAYKWETFFQADILHVISLTLIATAVLVALIKKQKPFFAITLLSGLLFVFLAPFVRSVDYSEFSVLLRPYLSIKYQSQFPLFPWSAFLLGGTIVGRFVLNEMNQNKNPKTLQRSIALISFSVIVLSLLIEWLPWNLYSNHNFWNASPEFFFVRFGIVCLLLVGCWFVEHLPSGYVRKGVALIGTESLLVYVAHLLVVYGHTFEWSFIRFFGPTLGYAECIGLTAGLILAMYLLAFGWKFIKQKNKNAATVIQYATLAGIVIRFVVW
ncbi:MAG: DUF1624 domain-containing protein [Ignavibacteriae bacterium]|nr:DUF1624 domain-containing protein [Ignavibacteriota bacterium]